MIPNMQPEILSRELIKPSSSNHKKFHNLSFFDQMSPPVYVPLLFFYTSQHIGEISKTCVHKKSSVLKLSLSAALSHYYPLAGRIKDNVILDCNDDGVLFLEAKTDNNLSQVLKNPEDEILKLFLPDSLCYKGSISNGPVAIQVTYFGCGGMSIGLCLCHKILDMASVCSFINKWASMATNKSDQQTNCTSPEFNIGSLYPPLNDGHPLFLKQEQQQFPRETNICVSKRLVFHASEIAKLKEMVADQVPNPTRVEVVSALIYKTAISASAKASSSTIMYHAINLRTSKICPELSGRNIGNAAGIFLVPTWDDREVDLGGLVKEFRREKTWFSSSINKEEVYAIVLENMKTIVEHKQVYGCSSWCRFPFYEVDFGWGKPFWVTRVCWEQKNGIGLMDTREGHGIEAFITLEQKHFDVFQHDEELLSFCSTNPSVLV